MYNPYKQGSSKSTHETIMPWLVYLCVTQLSCPEYLLVCCLINSIGYSCKRHHPRILLNAWMREGSEMALNGMEGCSRCLVLNLIRFSRRTSSALTWLDKKNDVFLMACLKNDGLNTLTIKIWFKWFNVLQFSAQK